MEGKRSSWCFKLSWKALYQGPGDDAVDFLTHNMQRKKYSAFVTNMPGYSRNILPSEINEMQYFAVFWSIRPGDQIEISKSDFLGRSGISGCC